MEQIIYADILFLIDLSMDFLALYITATLLKIRFYSGSAIISATVGAAFSVFSVVMREESIVASVIISFIMCLLAYKRVGFTSKGKALFLFYIVNMLLGGAMTALFNLFNSITEGERNILLFGEVNTVRNGMPVVIFYIGFGVIIICFKLVTGLMNRRPANEPIIISVKLCGKTSQLTVSEDSGNRVCEPISGEPIIFIKESVLQKITDKATFSALKMGKEFYDRDIKSKARVVIYQTLSGSEMCVCIKPDSIVVNKREAAAWVAIASRLHMSEIDGIIPSSLLR